MRGFLLLLALAFVAAASAQNPPAATSEDLVIRSATKLIEVNVVVLDKQGRAVPGLEKEDFEVFDNGGVQPIAVFIAEQNEPAGSLRLPPNVFTNRISTATGKRSGYAVILLDWLNTGWADQARSRQKVMRMLSQVELSDKVALFALDRRLRVVHDFTSDTALLLDKLAPLRGQSRTDLESEPASPLDASVGHFEIDLFGTSPLSPPTLSASKAEKIHFLDRRVYGTLEAFEQIAAHLAGLSGRKSLIWVSAGFPMVVDSRVIRGASPGERTYTAEIQRAVQRLNDADVAVYPVDARGLLVSSAGYVNVEVMKELASQTGGYAFHDRNDLDAGIRVGLDDLRVNYTLGYYLPESAKPGRYHRIRVRSRHSGLDLRYRKGYRVSETKPSPAKQTQADMEHAFLSPADATAIPMTVQTARQGDSVALQVSLDLPALALDRNGDRWTGGIELMARFAGDSGNQVGSIVAQTADINLRQEAYEEALAANGFSFPTTLQIPSDATSLRVLVRDPASGKIGTVSIPLSLVGN